MANQTQNRSANDSGNIADQPSPTVTRQAQEEINRQDPKPVGGVYVPNTTDPGDTPTAGDTDPDSTASADETGQGGDVTETKKRKGLTWA